MTEDQIKYMVNRFLCWKLPETFNPDGGISFKAAFNEHTSHPMKSEPSGTNLFDATQADAMVRHMVEGMPRHGDAESLVEDFEQACFDYERAETATVRIARKEYHETRERLIAAICAGKLGT